MSVNISRKLKNIYFRLFSFFGPQRWWPGDTPFEIMIGAILTQNTAWSNVEKAISSLKDAGALNPEAILAMSEKKLSSLIRPAGYHNVKAGRLKGLAAYLNDNYGCEISRMRLKRTSDLRDELLNVKGVGPETADSILLYALNKPVFVVDAYTKRLFLRHGLTAHSDDYHTVQNMFSSHLDSDVRMYNEYHALIVAVCKAYCRTKPVCSGCPLRRYKVYE